MKKIRLCPGYMPEVYKMLKKMKLTVFLILITFLGSVASESYSQATKLTLDVKNSTVKEILNQIEDQSEFRFFYSDKVDVERVTSISQKDKRIFDILDELFENTGVTYDVRGRQIALSKEDELSNFLLWESPQQPGTITGKVTDENGEPLPGVTVMIKGTTQGTVTNAAGEYTISAIPEDAALQFSFVGMQPQEIEVNNQTNINVIMLVDAIGIEEVVAIGYGTIKKSDLTGSVTSVKTEDLDNVKMQSIDQALAGRAAGVQVIQSSGVPGSAPAIRVRGTTSLQGANEPLYVVDGFPIYAGGGSGNAGTAAGSSNISGIANINPNDIESIEILKEHQQQLFMGREQQTVLYLLQQNRALPGMTKFHLLPIMDFRV
ncbi:MAG: carboxypeptidase-like regulatory domain-containing protein [Prolixibacteraceae bacterium]|nr:carboxypeptidase-like regulatory domain-containing protein [Prolixibacteraceae bacterium]